MKKLQNQKGITLIALIITIIVMLILVAVTVNVALNGGLFNTTELAKEETKMQAEKEMLWAETIAAYDAETGMIDEGKLRTNLEAVGWTVETENGQTMYISPSNRKYTIGQNFEIAYIGENVEESVIALEDDNNPLTIGSIEDLVELAIAVNSGTTYEGETITLLTSLDFDKPESYRNAEDTSYGDINGNGIDEAIITELTTGLGFEPIGKTTGIHADLEMPIGNLFGGVFEGNGKTISNLYINRPEGCAALFGDISTKATIRNLTIKNPEIYGVCASGLAIAYSIPNEPYENVINYMNDVLTIENCHTKGGKIGAVNENCISQITAGIFINPTVSIGKINIKGNSNGSTISGMGSAGITCIPFSMGEITITKCENYGNIIIEDIDIYKSNSKDVEVFTAGCAFAVSGEGTTITECSNFGDLMETCGYLTGIVLGSGVSILDCLNYGTLNYSGENYVYIVGIYSDPGYDNANDIEGRVEKCKNYGDINVNSEGASKIEIAGITDMNDGDTILQCINKGNITVSGSYKDSASYYCNVSGIDMGKNNVYNCINYGSITIADGLNRQCAAGISYNGNKIVNCTNYGDVNAEYVAGIGYWTSRSNTGSSNTQIYNCYNLGNITTTSNSYCAGVGVESIIKNSYNLGNVSEIDNGIGHDSTITNCYDLTGNETLEEKQALLEALNSNRETDAETPWSEWKIDPNINYGYPAFVWQQAE